MDARPWHGCRFSGIRSDRISRTAGRSGSTSHAGQASSQHARELNRPCIACEYPDIQHQRTHPPLPSAAMPGTPESDEYRPNCQERLLPNAVPVLVDVAIHREQYDIKM